MGEKIIVGEQDINVDLIDSFPNHPYSCLFASYCRSQNIPCYVVDGDKRNNIQYRHTWNRVYFNGSWCQLDVTFDSIQIKEQGQLYGFRKIESYGAPDDEYRITRIY